MRQITALTVTLFTILFLSSCENRAQQKDKNSLPQQEAFVKNVNAEEFKKLADSGNGIILDVRTPGEVAGGYINNASIINIYDKDFVEKINLISKEKEIYVYCKSGGRSSQAAKILQQNGFTRIFHLGKGLLEWEAKGLPLERTEIAADEKIEEISLEEFKALLDTDKPVLVDFHTVWCSPCRKMAPVIDKIEEEYNGKAVVKRIDVDKSKEVGKEFNIRGVPVFILFKDGKNVWTHDGIISKQEITAQLDKNL